MYTIQCTALRGLTLQTLTPSGVASQMYRITREAKNPASDFDAEAIGAEYVHTMRHIQAMKQSNPAAYKEYAATLKAIIKEEQQ